MSRRKRKERKTTRKIRIPKRRINKRSLGKYTNFSLTEQTNIIVLSEMKNKSSTMSTSPRKNFYTKCGDTNDQCDYHTAKGRKTYACRILKMDIESLIQWGLLKNFMIQHY